MIPLDYAGTRKLQLVTAQNGASVVVGFSDFDTSTKAYDRGVPQCTTISSATTTDICATPASGKIRDVDSVFIANTYAGSNAMTLQVASGAGGPFIIENFTLLQNESAEYTHGSGVRIKDATGQYKVTTTGTAGAFSVGGALTVGGAVVGITSQDAFNTVSTTLNIGGAATTLSMGAGAASTLNANFTTAINLNTAAIVSNQTTVAVINTNATTVNAFGAASTALNIGHASAAAAFAGGVTVASGKTLTLTGATVAGAPTWSSSQAITLSTAAQPNVTSVGTLTSATIYTAGGASNLTLGGDATGTTPRILFKARVDARYNFMLSGNDPANDTFTITPSTTVGGTTFTTPVLAVTASGAMTVGNGTGSLTAGAITSNGGLQTFGANDSGGSGYRLVRVPNV